VITGNLPVRKSATKAPKASNPKAAGEFYAVNNHGIFISKANVTIIFTAFGLKQNVECR
jgi:hypothetical protein